MGRPVDQARAETTRLGSYEVVRKLARGGMAELFLSRTVGPEGFEKLVVLKKILPTYAENPKFVRLFLDEAKLAATLDHPHIAHVYDMGKVDGHYFFTMEYVHGQDVRSTMRRTARLGRELPIDHAVQITRNVAAALHYAHERTRPDGSLLDIVHRDVSPSNVLVSYDGAVKLVDFGVAKATTSTVKTRTGTLKGKISYMSPEQAKGAHVDRRSDIFALGIMLWEMVTMQRLYKADNDLATIQMIINSRAQPPSQLRPDCSPELERIVLRALAINPDERYATAEQLQLDLEELAREQKLNQSTVSLRTYMHELFDDEIRAWSAAQASGQTLTEHLIDKATEMTTPVSESELYADDEFDDDDEEEDNPSESAAPTMTQLAPTQQIAPAPVVAVDASLGGGPTPFPIAPREWRPVPLESAVHINVNEEQRKRIIIGSSIGFGVIVLLVATIAARNPRPVATAGAPDRVEMQPGSTVEMKATPAQPPAETTPPIAEQTPGEEPPAVPPAGEEQPAVEPPAEEEAVPVAPDAESDRRAKKRRATRAREKADVTKPAAAKPATKPVEKSAKPVEVKPPPKPSEQESAKPLEIKPPPPKPPAQKPYDPNSPLAPP